MSVSEWNIDFLIAVLLLNESLVGSGGKANSSALGAGFGLSLLNTPRVLRCGIQQMGKGAIVPSPCLCHTPRKCDSPVGQAYSVTKPKRVFWLQIVALQRGRETNCRAVGS